MFHIIEGERRRGYPRDKLIHVDGLSERIALELIQPGLTILHEAVLDSMEWRRAVGRVTICRLGNDWKLEDHQLDHQ